MSIGVFGGRVPVVMQDTRRHLIIEIEGVDVLFESVKAANEYYGKKYSNISAACRGEREVALGYHWKYLD